MSDLDIRHRAPRNELPERLKNLWWEYRLGISTRGLIDVHNTDSCPYGTSNYSGLWKLLRYLALQPSDTFVDIGCGKGRMLCCAGRYSCRYVIGVDLSADLCAQARANARRMRGRRTPIVVQEGYAEKFDYAEGNVFYMFNPFGAATLDIVLEKIQHDVSDRAIRLVYANPNAAQEAVLTKHSWLERYEFWDQAEKGNQHSVAFYRSR